MQLPNLKRTNAVGGNMTRFTLLGAILALAACGMHATPKDPGLYDCLMLDGSRKQYHTDDLQFFVSLFADSWAQDRITGKRVPLKWCDKALL